MARIAKSKEIPLSQRSEVSFEEALGGLELIVKQLENSELSLEEALKQFTEGMSLSRICLAKLNTAEQAMDTILLEEQGKLVEKPLIVREEDEEC